jgi:outer membrane protein assembly factor BamB
MFKTRNCFSVLVAMQCVVLIAFGTLQAQPQQPKQTDAAAIPVASNADSQPSVKLDSKPDQQEKSQRKDWPLFRGDVASTGALPESIGDELTEVWKFKYPKGAFDSSPIVVSDQGNKTVYVAGMTVNVIGKLVAIDFESGEKKWEFESEEGFMTSPSYRDGRVVVGDMMGTIFCVDDQGKLVWKYAAQGEINSCANFFESLVLIGSQDATLYAFDAATGDISWKHETSDQIRCTATLAEDRCFLAGCDGFMHAVSVKDGTEIGVVEIGSPTGCTPAVLGDNVYFGTEQGDFYSVNWKTMKVNWKFADPDGVTSIRGSAAVTKNQIVYGARNRKLYSLDPATGKPLWTVTLKARIDGSPVIAGDRVYVGSTDGRLTILDLKNGTELWQKQLDGSILGSPAIADGHLVVATERGVVYCLKGKIEP